MFQALLKDLSYPIPGYYDAIEPELLELSSNDDLVIMSAGLFTTNRMHPDLKRCVPSVSADFQLYRQCINNTNVSKRGPCGLGNRRVY